jgi:hypothetical protein
VVAEEAEAKEGERGEGTVEPLEPFDPCRRCSGPRPTVRRGAGRALRVGSVGTGTGFEGAVVVEEARDGVETCDGVGVVLVEVDAGGVDGAEETVRVSLLFARTGGAGASFHSVLSG